MTSAPSLPGRWLVTGLRGTVAPKVAAELVARGGEPVAWDRDAIPVDDVAAGTAFLSSGSWAGVLHVGMGPEEWAARLAGFAAAQGIPFAFTSTVSVFGDEPDGPHHPGDERTAQDDYGRYKARCEDAVAAAYPAAIVARIGWQIHPDGQGNNMLAQLDQQAAAAGGVIRASTRWRPATSWMTDTATALLEAVTVGRSGVLHLDSNAVDAWSFAQVVRHVAAVAGRDWRVEETADVVQDHRLVGHENLIPRLSARPCSPRAPGTASERMATLTSRVRDTLALVDTETDKLLQTVTGMSEDQLTWTSLSQGWTRAHVLAHLARNADSLRNLVHWAEDGQERPAYPSEQARDEAIVTGARRSLDEILDDLRVSAATFRQACGALAGSAAESTVRTRTGTRVTGAQLPALRLAEVVIHHVDLDLGYRFDDADPDWVWRTLTRGVRQWESAGAPHLVLRPEGHEDLALGAEVGADVSNGGTAGRDTDGASGAEPQVVSGTPGALLLWLTRGVDRGLRSDADLPVPPPWG